MIDIKRGQIYKFDNEYLLCVCYKGVGHVKFMILKGCHEHKVGDGFSVSAMGLNRLTLVDVSKL